MVGVADVVGVVGAYMSSDRLFYLLLLLLVA